MHVENKGGHRASFRASISTANGLMQIDGYFLFPSNNYPLQLCHTLFRKERPYFYIFEINFPAVTLSILNVILTNEDFFNIDNFFLVPYDRIAHQK